MRKRSKCAFLATAMAATTILAAGCGNSASGGQNTADSAERVPIRWLTTGDAAAEAIQDNDRIIEAINEKLGIDLTVEIVPEANTEKVNVAMASGDFPDVVTGAYGTSATQQWIDDGMVIPLNDYMDSFPSMKAWLENYEWSAQNGKYYGMPFIAQYSVANTLIVMRQDWLDNLGLSYPQTLDEKKTSCSLSQTTIRTATDRTIHTATRQKSRDSLTGYFSHTDYPMRTIRWMKTIR